MQSWIVIKSVMLTGTISRPKLSFREHKIFRWMIGLSGNKQQFEADETFSLFISLFTTVQEHLQYLQHHQRNYLQYSQVS